MNTRVAVLVFALMLAGCQSEPVIDATTFITLQDSASLVERSLPEDRQAEFDRAFGAVAYQNVNEFDLVMRIAQAPDSPPPQAVIQAVHGKTGRQILAEAESILATKKLEMEAELAELQEKVDRIEAQKAELSALHVSDMRVLPDDRYRMIAGATLQATIKNGLDRPVSSLFAEAKMMSPGRSSAWMTLELRSTVPGGIEPGETVTHEFLVTSFDGWRSSVDIPDDVYFDVTTNQASGPDNQPVVKVEELSFSERSRLQHLTQELGNL